MNHFLNVVIAFCIFGYGTAIRAQNSIPATGGNATGAGGTVSYTIGQVVYTSVSGANGNVLQGVQVPYEISVITAIEKTEDIFLEMSVYPNPANSYVTLKVAQYNTDDLKFTLYDVNGLLLQVKKVDGNETLIQLGNMLPGTYLLKVTDQNKEIKTFKIIKK
jgi:hypothetical protein